MPARRVYKGCGKWVALCAVLFLVLGLGACTRTIHAVTDEPIRPDPGNTSVGTNIDDWQIATLVGVNIKKADPGLERAHINVNAHNKVVLLTGEVPSAELRKLAGDTARAYRGVRQVYNELQVQGSSTLLSRANDSWLSTKVKTKLLADKEIDSGRLSVITEGGVIYLMGIVNRAEAERATEVVRNTRGVAKVVRVFEYLD